MRERQQSSTTHTILFFMTLASDHSTGATGITPTVTLSKDGAAFAAAAGAVSEVGNGWYALAGNAADRGTLGPLAIHATGAACDPADSLYTIVGYDPFNGTTLGLTNLDAAVSTRLATSGYTAQSGDSFARLGAPAGASTAADIAAVKANAASIVAKLPTNAIADETLVIAATSSILTAVGTPAQASQIPANLSTLVITAGAFNSTALENAPTGSGGSGLTLATTLNAPRALDAVADAAITVNDALWAATCGAAGKEDASSSPNYVVKTPFTGTVIRSFVLTLVSGNPVARA